MRWFYSILSIVVLFQMFHFTSSASLPLQFSTDLITAHRGSSAVAPENTLSAIDRAIDDRAGIVEIDVRLTKDGVVVLSHDDSLQRTAGVDVKVSESFYTELLKYDVAQGFPSYDRVERIPTLTEALELAKGQIRFNVELKGKQQPAALATKVVEIIESLGMQQDSVITSFNMETLQAIHKASADIKTGFIIGSRQSLTQDIFEDELLDVLSLRASLINRNVMKLAREHELEVYAWTVNDRKLMQDMMRYQVDSIITDHPSMLYRLLNF